MGNCRSSRRLFQLGDRDERLAARTTVAMAMRLTTVFSICSRALRAVRCRSAESAPMAMLNTVRTACASKAVNQCAGI